MCCRVIKKSRDERSKTCSERCSTKMRQRNKKLNKRSRLNPVDTVKFNVEQWNKLVRQYGGRCAYCKIGVGNTVDHVVPLSRGGRHALSNVVPACKVCNDSKGNLFLFEWRVRSPVPIFDEVAKQYF